MHSQKSVAEELFREAWGRFFWGWSADACPMLCDPYRHGHVANRDCEIESQANAFFFAHEGLANLFSGPDSLKTDDSDAWDTHLDWFVDACPAIADFLPFEAGGAGWLPSL
jgi:hypothetical protein